VVIDCGVCKLSELQGYIAGRIWLQAIDQSFEGMNEDVMYALICAGMFAGVVIEWDSYMSEVEGQVM